jgi:hypothetical protein
MLCTQKRFNPSKWMDLHMNMPSSDRRAGISASLQMNHLQPLPQVHVSCYCDDWRFAVDTVFFVDDGWVGE